MGAQVEGELWIYRLLGFFFDNPEKLRVAVSDYHGRLPKYAKATLIFTMYGWATKPTAAKHIVPISPALKAEFTNAYKEIAGVSDFRNTPRRDRAGGRRAPIAPALSIFVGS